MTEIASQHLEPTSELTSGELLYDLLNETGAADIIVGPWDEHTECERDTQSIPEDGEFLDYPEVAGTPTNPPEETWKEEPKQSLPQRTKSTSVLEYEARIRTLDSPSNLRLVRRAQAGDQAAMDTLYTSTLPLVRGIVRSNPVVQVAIATGTMTHQECVQAGLIGAFQAIDRYDARKGAALGTTIYARVNGALKDELRSINAQRGATRTALRNLADAKKDPTGHEMHELVKAGGFVRFPVSMDQLLGVGEEGQELTLHDKLQEEDPEYAGVEFSHSALPRFLAAFAMLNEREQLVVGQHLDISPEPELSGVELAERFGVSESRISQIRSAGLKKIRVAMTSVVEQPPSKKDRETAAA